MLSKNNHRWCFLLVFLAAAGFGCHKLSKYHRTPCNLLITGCARSGTQYASHLLQECGLKIGHEKVQKDGVSSWVMCMDAKSVPWAMDARRKFRFAHVFHQVRHPLKVIASVQTEGEPSWRYIRSHIAEIKSDDPPIARGAKYWYYWNLKAQQQSEWTYRVEEIDAVWDQFCQRLGQNLDRSKVDLVSRNVNARQHAEISWEQLEAEIDPELYQNIRLLAQSYGYSLEN
jgi:hypothetical protein